MPEGGTVTVGTVNLYVKPSDKIPLPEGDYAGVSIENKGPGTAEKNPSDVLDPYCCTMKILGIQKRMGLGPAVARSILEEHGGCITVDSAKTAD